MKTRPWLNEIERFFGPRKVMEFLKDYSKRLMQNRLLGDGYDSEAKRLIIFLTPGHERARRSRKSRKSQGVRKK